MSIVRCVVVAVTAAVVSLGIVSAQEKQVEKKMPGAKQAKEQMMPKPGPEMDKLKRFVGAWSTAEKHEASEWGPAGEGKGTHLVRLGPGGFSLVEDYKSTNHMGAFAGHGVTLWDASAATYKSYWFDSMTPRGFEQSCRWEGSDFACAGEMMMEGKKIKSRSTTSGITPTGHTLVIESSTDGGPMKKMLTITFTKAAPKTPTQ